MPGLVSLGSDNANRASYTFKLHQEPRRPEQRKLELSTDFRDHGLVNLAKRPTGCEIFSDNHELKMQEDKIPDTPLKGHEDFHGVHGSSPFSRHMTSLLL